MVEALQPGSDPEGPGKFDKMMTNEGLTPVETDIWSRQTDTYDMGAAVEAGHDTFRQYLNDIGRIPLLNAEEEVELAKRIEAGVHAGQLVRLAESDDLDAAIADLGDHLANIPGNTRYKTKQPIPDILEALGKSVRMIQELPDEERQATLVDLRELELEGSQACHTFWLSNLRLVVSIAKQKRHNMSLQDMVQEGNGEDGLLRAVQKYDYTLGWKFSTYASSWISQNIDRAAARVGRTIRIPVPVIEQINKMNNYIREKTANGRDVTDEELAKHLKVEVSKIDELRQYDREPLSLNEKFGESDRELGEEIDGSFVCAESSPQTSSAELKAAVVKLTEQLKPKQTAVLKLLYGLNGLDPHTIEEVTSILALTPKSVVRMEAEARSNLRKLAGDKTVNEYLATLQSASDCGVTEDARDCENIHMRQEQDQLRRNDD